MKNFLIIVLLFSVGSSFGMERTTSQFKGCYATVIAPNEELRSNVASFFSASTAVSGAFVGIGVMRLLLPRSVSTGSIVGGVLGFVPVFHSSLLQPKFVELLKNPIFDKVFIVNSTTVLHKS